MSTRELHDRLSRRARHAGLVLKPGLAEGLEQYYQLLSKWNARINLTAFQLPHGGDDQAIDRLLLEPVVAATHLPPARRACSTPGRGGSPAIR